VIIRVGLLMFLLSGATQGCAGAPGREPLTAMPNPAERLFVAVFSLPEELDELYQTENQRLLSLCTVYRSACFSEHFAGVRRPVAVLRSSPDPAGPVVGQIVAHLKVSDQEFGGLDIDLEVEHADAPGRFHRWPNPIGDWGYGIYMSGVRPQPGWVQLFGAAFPPHAWLSVEGQELSGHVLTLPGQILHIRPLRATFPDGVVRLVEEGSYLVTEVTGDAVVFRSEIAADMPCGEPVEPVETMPPLLRSAPAELFEPDGRPRFTVEYRRGC
jgi:hypothetical protein